MGLASVLSQFWLKELIHIPEKSQGSLKEWLRMGRFTFLRPMDEQSFEIIDYKPQKKSSVWALGALASDINRFSSAAFESIDIQEVDLTFKKSLGWNLIRSYYAAFFGAHALLRVFGQSVSQLDREILSEIEKIADLYGVRPVDPNDQLKKITLKNGMYLITIIDNGAHYIVKGQRLDSKNGGTHELMWSAFNNLLGELQTALLSGNASGITSDLIDASDSIKNIRLAITGAGYNKGNWLSNMRNRINYNHSFDVWYPFGNSDSYYQGLSKYFDFDWDNELKINGIKSPTTDLQGFTETCGEVVSLCKDIVDLLHARSSTRHSFVRKHAHSYLTAVRSKNSA